jgi:hypothetical protein
MRIADPGARVDAESPPGAVPLEQAVAVRLKRQMAPATARSEWTLVMV